MRQAIARTARYRQIARITIGGIGLFLGALLLLRLPIRPGYTVLLDIGTAVDRNVIAGMFDPEEGEGSTFRWLSPQARLTLPPWQCPFLLTLRLTPAPVDGGAVDLAAQVDDSTPITLTVSGKTAVYHLLVEGIGPAPGNRVVYLRSGAFLQTAEDTREKSVALHWVGVQPFAREGLLSPCPALFLAIALVVLLFYLDLLVTRVPWGIALGLAATGPPLAAVLLWRAPSLALVFFQQLAWPALLLAAVALPSLLLLRSWDSIAPRLGQWATFRGLRIALLVLLALMVLGSVGLKLRAYLVHPSAVNLYPLQAEAFLQGQVSIPPHHYDAAVYRGRSYVPFPPFPALLLLPTTAIFGNTPLQIIFLNVVLTALNVFLLWRILRRLEVPSAIVPWLSTAFFLGSAYWLALVKFSETYFIAHLVAIAGMLWAIHEALGKGRGLLVGLCLGAAFLSRQMSLYALPFLLAALWTRPGQTTRRRIVNLSTLALSLGASLAVYLAFNWVRFGSPLDTGYAYIPLENFLQDRVVRFGLFNLVYVPSNLIHMFLQGFHIRFDSPDFLGGVQMDSFGTSLTFASPFVFLAFWARWGKNLLRTVWASIAITLVHTMFYYNNGWIQANAQRFSLDFFPLLIVLVALGSRRAWGPLWKAAVVLAVFLNTVALFWIPLIQWLLP